MKCKHCKRKFELAKYVDSSKETCFSCRLSIGSIYAMSLSIRHGSTLRAKQSREYWADKLENLINQK